jgi:AcrR family transcriptional regulator
MTTSMRAIRLAGEDLGDHRHVCALVDGPEDAYELLLPFILDGFAHGDRAIHLVDPEAREAHLERLATAGVDLTASTESGQLEIATWTDSYLMGGRFDRSSQLARIQQVLGEGPALGFPVTRVIGTMEWRHDRDPDTDLLWYESGLSHLLRSQAGVAVCAYDLNLHSARTIAAVMGMHHATVVGGVLTVAGGAARPSARDRLLAAASDLFYEKGIQATGVDTLIAAAGVAKATFYRHFPSKDDLVAAWLREPRTRWLDDVRLKVAASGADAEGRIPVFFDVVREWLEDADFRGCPYLNTAVELTGTADPARTIIRDYLQEVEDYLEHLLAEAGYRDSHSLAAKLQTLTAGAISLAEARGTGDSVDAARDAAVSIVASAKRA